MVKFWKHCGPHWMKSVAAPGQWWQPIGGRCWMTICWTVTGRNYWGWVCSLCQHGILLTKNKLLRCAESTRSRWKDLHWQSKPTIPWLRQPMPTSSSNGLQRRMMHRLDEPKTSCPWTCLIYIWSKVGTSRVRFKYATCSNIPYMTQAPAKQTCSYDWYKMPWHRAVREVLPPGWALV